MIPTAILLFTIFATLSTIHIYWAFGGKWGINAALPTNQDNQRQLEPSPLATIIVATGLLGFGLLYLAKVNLLPLQLPNWATQYGLWAIATIFLIRAIGDFKYAGFFKTITTTKFAHMDTKYYTPLCIIIAILTTILQLNN
jgi:glucan phosphoethanolaminetransferase (alkaline phosphatase superfamily)